MIVELDIAGAALACRVPETTRDVLHWRVWIASLEPSLRLRESVEWVREHVVDFEQWAEVLEHLDALESEEAGALFHLLAAGDVLCARAGLDDEVVEGIVTMRDRQNGIDPTWHPPSACECMRCLSNGEVENPDDMDCVYDVPPLSVHASIALGGLSDADDPYWMTQVRGALQRADGRYWAWQEHKRKEKDRKDEDWDETTRHYGLRT